MRLISELERAALLPLIEDTHDTQHRAERMTVESLRLAREAAWSLWLVARDEVNRRNRLAAATPAVDPFPTGSTKVAGCGGGCP